jgi:hypothetical protein
MSRPKAAETQIQINVRIPLTLKQKLDVMLWSNAEERVPYGAYTLLIEHLLRQWLLQQGLRP